MFEISLSAADLTVEPGGKAEIGLSVANTGTTVDAYLIEVSGVDPLWVNSTTPPSYLNPADRFELKITFAPPNLAMSKAGLYPVRVRVTRTGSITTYAGQPPVDTTLQFSADLALTVLPMAVLDFGVELYPRDFLRQNAKAVSLTLTNKANIDLTFELNAESDEQSLRYTYPKQVGIPANAKESFQLDITPQTQKFSLAKTKRSFQLTVKPVPLAPPNHAQSESTNYTPAELSGLSRTYTLRYETYPILPLTFVLLGLFALIMLPLGLLLSPNPAPANGTPTIAAFAPTAVSTPAPNETATLATEPPALPTSTPFVVPNTVARNLGECSKVTDRGNWVAVNQGFVGQSKLQDSFCLFQQPLDVRNFSLEGQITLIDADWGGFVVGSKWREPLDGAYTAVLVNKDNTKSAIVCKNYFIDLSTNGCKGGDTKKTGFNIENKRTYTLLVEVKNSSMQFFVDNYPLGTLNISDIAGFYIGLNAYSEKGGQVLFTDLKLTY
jgi:hypothetical protein